MRTNSAAGFDLMQADLVQVAVQSRMSLATEFRCTTWKAPTVLHYSIGEQITNHYDFVNPKTPEPTSRKFASAVSASPRSSCI